MILEVITLNLQESLIAERSGATQLELITKFDEGGLTPNIKVTREVTRKIKIPIMVMVRPHSNSFVYSKEDMKNIINSIKLIKQTKAHGIVFGSLTKSGLINKRQLEEVMKAKGKLKITFHRAFDELKDQVKGYRVLKKYKVNTILTSGGKNKAIDGINNLKKLIMESDANKNNPKILIGSGVGMNNIDKLFEKTKGKNYHVGSSVRSRNSIKGKISSQLVSKTLKKIKSL